MQIYVRLLSCAGIFCLALLSGCRSAWVQGTIVNAQNAPVSLVEVGYPGGSFGVQTIAAHANFYYRFRVLASGNITIQFSDAKNHSHTATGPAMEPGQQGSLRIEIEPDGKVAWTPALTLRK
jgi:hypothetical protein